MTARATTVERETVMRAALAMMPTCSQRRLEALLARNGPDGWPVAGSSPRPLEFEWLGGRRRHAVEACATDQVRNLGMRR